MSDWVPNVPTVVDGQTTFSAAGMNPILDALTSRTQFLYEQYTGLAGNQGYLLPDTGFAAGCGKGTIVAMSPAGTDTAGLYVPAEAVWSDSVRSDGSWIPSYKAYALGIVTTDIVNEGATIICNGWSADAELISLLAPDGVVGDYYLTRNGIATPGDDVTREMRVYCYSYLPSGKLFIKPALPEYAGHSHNHVLVSTSWVASTQVTGVTLPNDATYATDLSDSAALSALAAANPNHTCLVKNGEEVMEGTWGIVDNWLYITFNLEYGDVFSLHAITPLTANEPIVRSVTATSTNNLLDITHTGGKVFIGIKAPNEIDAYTGTGVVSLDANGIKTGRVVQELKAGPGISLSGYIDPATFTTVPGVVTVTATQFAGTMIDMNVCNLDRVVLGTSFSGVSYVFPAETNSLLIGTMRVPHFESNTVGGKLIFVFLGSSPGLQAYITVQPMPTLDEPALTAQSISRDVPATTGSGGGYPEDYCYRSEIDLGTDVLQSDALVVLRLVSNFAAQPITLISASLVLY